MVRQRCYLKSIFVKIKSVQENHFYLTSLILKSENHQIHQCHALVSNECNSCEKNMQEEKKLSG